MKISYDPKYDVLYLKFAEENVVDTIEVDGGVLIDYGKNREMVGIEIIRASGPVKKSITRDSHHYQASRRNCLNSHAGNADVNYFGDSAWRKISCRQSL